MNKINFVRLFNCSKSIFSFVGVMPVVFAKFLQVSNKKSFGPVLAYWVEGLFNFLQCQKLLQANETGLPLNLIIDVFIVDVI